jgi:hypothetical protein
MEAFLLGLSNGGVCLAYCAPVLVPCLLAAGGDMARSVGIVARFLGGRLLGYLLFGVISWAISISVLRGAGHREIIVGLAYMVLSVMLVFFGFSGRHPRCGAAKVTTLMERLLGDKRGVSFLIPAIAGLATGLNFCPPFLLAMAASAAGGGLLHSLFFFFMFFIGTSLFLIPAPFFGLLQKFPHLAIVGKLAAGIMGLYYFYSGIIMFAGGIKSL